MPWAVRKRLPNKLLDREVTIILALKGHHGVFEQEATDYVNDLKQKDFAGIKHDDHGDIDTGHGRIEVRKIWSIPCHWYQDKEK